jgi:hypothetical protein
MAKRSLPGRGSALRRTLLTVLPWVLRAVLPALLATVLLAGCASAPPFDPAGPCTSDGQVPGAYPELEALLPPTFRQDPPERVDSGRNCTAANLASLGRHGVRELRFAGALWELGDRSGVTMAVFSAPGLKESWMAEFYEIGARGARKTENVQSAEVVIAGQRVLRLDTLNAESFQSVVVWQPEDRDLIRVVLVGSFVREIQTRDAHDRVVEQAVVTFNGD